MEFLKTSGFTERLTGLPFTSWVRVESPWQARQSSTEGFCAAKATPTKDSRKSRVHRRRNRLTGRLEPSPSSRMSPVLLRHFARISIVEEQAVRSNESSHRGT